MTLTLQNGKYTVTQHPDGRLTALRYGEPWRDLTGDKLFLALVSEVEALRDGVRGALNDSSIYPQLSLPERQRERLQRLLNRS